MKRYLKFTFGALFCVALSVISVACDNGGSETPAEKLPAAAGIIEGPDKVMEGYSITLSVGHIDGADTYKWTKDGAHIQHSVSRTLEVTEVGVYRVAGVNSGGTGEPSEPKTVVLSDEKFLIDRMVGKWDVTEYIANGFNGNVTENNHVITITKIDSETVEISNLTWRNYPNDEGEFGDTVSATIDSDAGTMTIFPNSEFTPTWVEDYATILSPAIHTSPGENLGLAFPAQTFTEDENGKLKVEIITGDLTKQLNLGSETITVPVSYLVTTMRASVYTGTLAYYLGTTWVKQ